MKTKSFWLVLVGGLLLFAPIIARAASNQAINKPPDSSLKTATPSEEFGACHDALLAPQAVAQGPHEAPVGAGEDRILSWVPDLKAGAYKVQARLIFDLNRYNERSFAEDLTESGIAVLTVTVKGTP